MLIKDVIKICVVHSILRMSRGDAVYLAVSLLCHIVYDQFPQQEFICTLSELVELVNLYFVPTWKRCC